MFDLSQLWAEQFPIAPHAVMAFAAVILGLVQFFLPKGTSLHRWLGYLWVVLMAGIAISAIFIHKIRVWGDYSPIHLFIPITLFSLLGGILAARRGMVQHHRYTMISLYLAALVITGLFTFVPGRAMYRVLFGGG